MNILLIRQIVHMPKNINTDVIPDNEIGSELRSNLNILFLCSD